MSTCKLRCFVPILLPLGTNSDEALIWSYPSHNLGFLPSYEPENQTVLILSCFPLEVIQAEKSQDFRHEVSTKLVSFGHVYKIVI